MSFLTVVPYGAEEATKRLATQLDLSSSQSLEGIGLFAAACELAANGQEIKEIRDSLAELQHDLRERNELGV
ncbi:MAG: hypothetical protein OXG37_09960 [Actinomycetia bacterium]|nr:hypothetical protein [Actinomycetes bacterium]